jgi:hypothetical protein
MKKKVSGVSKFATILFRAKVCACVTVRLTFILSQCGKRLAGCWKKPLAGCSKDPESGA